MVKKTKTYKLIRLEESDFNVLSSIFKNSFAKISQGTSSLPDEITLAVPRIVEALDGAEVQSEVEEVKPTATASAPMKTDFCKKHPVYGAKRAPRTDCAACWAAYKKFNPLSYDKARKAFKRKVNSAK